MTAAIQIPNILKPGNPSWQILKKNWVISLSNKFVLLFLILSVALIAWSYTHMPPTVPLWFSKPWGDERLAGPLWLLLLPGSSAAWYVAGRILAVHYLSDYLIFAQALFLTSLLGSFLSFVVFLNIIFLVT